MTSETVLQAQSTPSVALTIAGSDSGGGAGIAADLHTFAAHHVFGTVALTAVTAQNTEKVHEIVAFEPQFVDAQIDAVLEDFDVQFAKTGMLGTVPIVEALAERAAQGRLPRLVIDPVLVSSTGSSLLAGDAHGAYRRLLGFAVVATPNLTEAEVLLGQSISSVDEMAEAPRAFGELGVQLTVVKGGHLNASTSTDVVFDSHEIHYLSDDRVETNNTHGTGCTLSGAITANLCLGYPPLDAIKRAKDFVTKAIQESISWTLGSGIGPINNFGYRTHS